MKQFYTFLVLAFTIVVGNAQIINFPDANFKAKLLAASPSNQIGRDSSGNYIKIDANNDGEIDVNEAHQISWLDINNQNAASSVLISNVTGIENFINLIRLNIAYNTITAVNLSTFTSLQVFLCQLNQITSLDFTGLTSVTGITAFQNQISSINVDGLVNLVTIYCDSNQLTTLNLNSCRNLNNAYFNSNQLISVYLKNGKNEANIGLGGNPTLRYICADEGQLNSIQNLLDVFVMINCNIGTYCTFTPGGVFYSINGTSKFDSTSNGCDASDINLPYMKLNITNGSNTTSLIANSTGNYSISPYTGTNNIIPIIENSTYYNIYPTNASFTFDTNSIPVTQDFCITPNGIHQDLEVILIPTSPARPGFIATYKLIYKNKGTQTTSGYVYLNYSANQNVMTLNSATPNVSTNTNGTLTWDYTNLQPFETRTILFSMQLNTPTQTPALNGGDDLGLAAIIYPIVDDEYYQDNHSQLKQIVVNSYDPNDKTCLEGNTITPSMVGNYVHYVIRFENTGTFPAENVVVSDMIDLTKFDIASLVPQSSSHSFVTRINNTTGKVEFIFENINLPFDDANNDGYVAFKIKTKPTLVLGNTFSNTANIYFDYNFPIVTNTASTTVSLLNTQDFDFSSVFRLSPVPTKDVLTITNNQNLTITSVSIYNTLGQLGQVSTNPSESIDVSSLKTGNYVIKIISDKGTASGKFIKE